MIIHRLIALHLNYEENAHTFFSLQAEDAISWLDRSGVKINDETRVLDLGAGQGHLGAQCHKRGSQVTFADVENLLLDELSDCPFLAVDLDHDDPGILGEYDVVLCSNVLEHLACPHNLLHRIKNLLAPGGVFYLSWTNWFSPWGGHEFSPFHYLGPKLGVRVHDWLGRPKRVHTPYRNLFPSYIGRVIRTVRRQPGLRLRRVAPRYYTELAFLAWLPVIREFLTWNCAMQIERTA